VLVNSAAMSVIGHGKQRTGKHKPATIAESSSHERTAATEQRTSIARISVRSWRVGKTIFSITNATYVDASGEAKAIKAYVAGSVKRSEGLATAGMSGGRQYARRVSGLLIS
jgi:hypothetical protein